MNSENPTQYSTTCKLSIELQDKLIEITRKAPDATWQWVAPDQIRIDVPFHGQSYLFNNSAELIASMRLKNDAN